MSKSWGGDVAKLVFVVPTKRKAANKVIAAARYYHAKEVIPEDEVHCGYSIEVGEEFSFGSFGSVDLTVGHMSSSHFLEKFNCDEGRKHFKALLKHAKSVEIDQERLASLLEGLLFLEDTFIPAARSFVGNVLAHKKEV